MVKYNNQPLMIMGQSWMMATYAVSVGSLLHLQVIFLTH
jgi:hypothetical protein